MGHKSVQTTFQYVHLGPEEMRSEAERVAGNGVKRQVPNHSTMQDNGAAIQLKSLYDQGILSKDEYLLKMETLLGVL